MPAKTLPAKTLPVTFPAKVEAAVIARMTNAAHRKAADPDTLALAIRVVRAALAQKAVTLAELTPLLPAVRRPGGRL